MLLGQKGDILKVKYCEKKNIIISVGQDMVTRIWKKNNNDKWLLIAQFSNNLVPTYLNE